VGNLDDCVKENEKRPVKELIQDAFKDAGAAEQGAAQIMWSKDAETVSAWRSDVNVKVLKPLSKMGRLDGWRTVDRFKVSGATEHGSCSLLVYNQHQPSSTKRPWRTPSRITFCAEILFDSCEEHSRDATNVGFVFGGDANCNLSHWSTALLENKNYQFHFKEVQYVWANNEAIANVAKRKLGDLIVAGGIDGFIAIQEDCCVKNRDPAHDCMIAGWCYRARSTTRAELRPAKRVELLRAIMPDDVPHGERPVMDLTEGDSERSMRAKETAQSSESSASEQSEDEPDFTGEQSPLPADEHGEEVQALGFALAKSALLVPQFATSDGPRNCLDASVLNTIVGACSKEDKVVLEEAVNRFFTERSDAGATEHGAKRGKRPTGVKAAYRLKSKEAIIKAWEIILEKRREVEPRDCEPIKDPNILGGLYMKWMDEWLKENLTAEQTRRLRREHTSIFAAHVKNTLGGRHFLMAILQTGITWIPTADLIRGDFDGAVEHVAKHFTTWVHDVVRAIRKHKEDPKYLQAKKRSGTKWGEHGLTAQQEKDRKARNQARATYHWTQKLHQQLNASKGKGRQGTGKGKGKHGATEQVVPKSWDDITQTEQWYLHELWNDNLWQKMTEAEAKMHAVQAAPFSMYEHT
jgi:hypothetical protein